MSHASEEILKFTYVNVRCMTSLLTALNLSEKVLSLLFFLSAALVPLSPSQFSLSQTKPQKVELIFSLVLHMKLISPFSILVS